MNSDPLDDLLDAYAKQSTPPPSQLATGVWHKIARHRNRTLWQRLLHSLEWHELFREPRVALSALALALLIGLMPAFATRSYGQVKLARESLHFEVFSSNIPSASFWSGVRDRGNSP